MTAEVEMSEQETAIAVWTIGWSCGGIDWKEASVGVVINFNQYKNTI